MRRPEGLNSLRGRTDRESRSGREDEARYRVQPTTPVVRACSRVSIRNPRRLMACPLPFRPWLSPGPRVFGFRTTEDQSTDPHAGPLLHLRATPVACPDARRPAQKAKPTWPLWRNSSLRSMTLQHIQTEEPFFAFGFRPNVPAALPHLREVPPSGFGYPLGGVSPPALGNLFSSPRSWASLFRAFIRPRGRPRVSPEPSARALPCQTARLGNGAPAASAYEASSAFRLPRLFISGECGLCPPELRRLPGLCPPDIGRSISLLPAPLALHLPTSGEAGSRSPRGSLPAARHLPSFEGRPPAWRSRPAVICHALGA
jgi:hypothetical protein